MKVDFNQSVLELDGTKAMLVCGAQDVLLVLLRAGIPQPIAAEFLPQIMRQQNAADVERSELTYKKLAVDALGAPDGAAAQRLAIQRVRLADRIQGSSSPIEIDDHEKALILECVRRTNTSVVAFYRMSNLLNGVVE